jgi:hypothetical protein
LPSPISQPVTIPPSTLAPLPLTVPSVSTLTPDLLAVIPIAQANTDYVDQIFHTVQVIGLYSTITSGELRAIFSPVGTILQVFVI